MDAGSFALLTNLAEMAMRGLEKEAFGKFTDIEHLPPAPSRVEVLQQAPNSVYVNESGLNVKLISCVRLSPAVALAPNSNKRSRVFILRL